MVCNCALVVYFSAILYKVCWLCCFLCFCYLDSHSVFFPSSLPFAPFFMCPCLIFSHILLFSSAYFCAKLTPFFLFSFPLCISVIGVLPVSLCLALICWSVLLQLSVSQSTYDSQTYDELSTNQSMSFSPSNSAQHISCFDPGPSSAHSNTGANRQVSVGGWKLTFL